MIRTPHHLPDLSTFFTGFQALDKSQTSSYALYTELKKIISVLQSNKSVLFYSTREIASFFKVSQRIVVRVYADLEAEGLMIRQRATGTWLRPLKSKASVDVQGVVGLPIWKWGYCHFYDWRYFLDQMEDKLRHHHYVGDFIPFNSYEDEKEGLLERLLSHRLDYLIWYKPLEAEKEMIETLQDRGVKVAVITDGARLPCRSYWIDEKAAIRNCIDAWEKGEITGMTLLVSPREKITSSLLLKELFESSGMKHDTMVIPSDDFPAFVASLKPDRSKAVIIPDAQFLNAVNSLYNADFRHLLEIRRVALLPMILGNPADFSGYTVDMITCDVEKFTELITSDLSKGKFLNQSETVRIEPKLSLNADAAQFTRIF